MPSVLQWQLRFAKAELFEARAKLRQDCLPYLDPQLATLKATVWFVSSFQGLWRELRLAYVCVHFFHQWAGWLLGPGFASGLIAHLWHVRQRLQLLLALLAELPQPKRCFDS